MAKMLEMHPDLVRLATHDLGRTAASLAISAGANVKSVKKMLGRTSAAMTLDVYADLFDDDLDAVGDALSAAGAPDKIHASPLHSRTANESSVLADWSGSSSRESR